MCCPAAGQTLIVAGVLISIALNPLTFQMVEPLQGWIRSHPQPRIHVVVFSHNEDETKLRRRERALKMLVGERGLAPACCAT